MNSAAGAAAGAPPPSSGHYPPPPSDARPASFSSSATPTSDYGMNPPSSSRSGTFPADYLNRPPPYADGAPRYPPPPSHVSVSSAGMIQFIVTYDPVHLHVPEVVGFDLPVVVGFLRRWFHLSLGVSPDGTSDRVDGRSNEMMNHDWSDRDDERLDAAIAATSPTYPPPQYASYPPPPPPPPTHEMAAASYAGHPNPYGRPEWGPYGPHPAHTMAPYGTHHMAVSGPGGPPPISPPHRPPQVYSFVPIPGAQQHKRPRRRYEEIERMYRCDWKGCEKAYGTLNHLNAHVTMQSHGVKRTPEEFKDIRKEWKARKKDEENARKAEEERQRAAMHGQMHHGLPMHAHPESAGPDPTQPWSW
ncbi:MAG: ATP-dependent RNA helicase dbp2 [Watsoniomyces obsoletus]|nr:MAG: ATP-dependent RNA helicase dbp2 [Watsoniomyces obsoletus]